VDAFIGEILVGVDAALGHGRLLNERTEIREALSEVTSAQALIRVCDYFAAKPGQLDDVFLSDNFNEFVGNAVTIYRLHADDSVYGAVMRLYAALCRHYERKFVSRVADFFIQTGTQQKAVDQILATQTTNERCVGEAIMGFATRPILENLIQRYQHKGTEKRFLDGIYCIACIEGRCGTGS